MSFNSLKVKARQELQSWRYDQKEKIEKQLRKQRRYMQDRAKHLCPICKEKMRYLGIKQIEQDDHSKSWIRLYMFQKTYYCYHCNRFQFYFTNKKDE